MGSVQHSSLFSVWRFVSKCRREYSLFAVLRVALWGQGPLFLRECDGRWTPEAVAPWSAQSGR